LSFESQVAIHTFGFHRVYIHGIHKIESFVSEGVTCKFAKLAQNFYQVDYCILECDSMWWNLMWSWRQ